MSRLILSLAMVATLAACSSAPVSKQEQSAKLVEKTVPEWFLTAVSTPTEYKSAGDGVSGSISGALGNARANAFEGICQAAGGVVRSQTKVFRQDTESKSTSMSTTAIRNFCPDVDVSGASIEKQVVVRDGERFRAFVLVSLDKGAASDKAVRTNAEKEFKELDKLNENFQRRSNGGNSQPQSVAPTQPKAKSVVPEVTDSVGPVSVVPAVSSPVTAVADAHPNNGFGNGDQTAPGKSGPQNNAENADSPKKADS